MTGAIVSMAAFAAGLGDIRYAAALTGRPAAIETPLNEPRFWLTPPVVAWDAVSKALDLLSIAGESVLLPRSGPEIEKTCLRLLSCGPVLWGPLRRDVLWKRVEGRYWAGSTHFVMVLCADDKGVVYHDPEGLPFARKKLSELIAAKTTDTLSGLVQIIPGPPISISEIRYAAIEHIRAVRKLAAARLDNGAMGLSALADALPALKLVGSMRHALDIALANRGRSIAQIRDLLEPSAPGLRLLAEYSLSCARARWALLHDSVPNLAASVRAMARSESGLDEIIGSQ